MRSCAPLFIRMPPPSKSLGPSRPPRRQRAIEAHASAEERLDFLLEASERLAAAEDTPATLQALAEIPVPKLSDGCLVSLANGHGALRLANFTHADRVLAKRLATAGESGILPNELAEVHRTGRSKLVECTAEHADDHGIRSAMLVPLRHGERAIGVIALLSSRPLRYEALELKLVEKLASRAALAIERARLLEYERRTADRLRLLQSLTSGLSGAVALEDVAELIVKEVPAALGAKMAAVFIKNATSGMPELLAHDGIHQDEALHDFQLGEDHPLMQALRTGKPMWIESTADFERQFPEALRIPGFERGAVHVPLVIDDKIVGALALGFGDERSFDDTEKSFVLTVASQCAQALDRARLYSEAEQALRWRDDFLSLASHELNTPLTSLKLALGHLGRSQHEPSAIARLLAVIERQSDRLGNLVADLLDVSRLTAGNVSLELVDIDLVAVVNETITSFATDLERSGSQLSMITPQSLVGHWDRHRLEQIASCLVSNAIKFGRGKPIEIVIEHAGESARLSVRDAGIGIPKERQARIFERFERAVATPHFGGFGLGLWLSRRVIEAMGGTIRVESKLGLGTAFFVELPLHHESQPAS